MIFQLLFDGILITALVLPFASLTKSYGNTQNAYGAIGTVFYRYWLLPGAMLISYLAFWILPDENIGLATEFVLSILALYFFVRSMWLTVRLTYGVGTIWSIAVVGVPWIIALLAVALVLPFLASSLGVTSQEALSGEFTTLAVPVPNPEKPPHSWRLARNSPPLRFCLPRKYNQYPLGRRKHCDIE